MAGLASSVWPKFQRDLANTGRCRTRKTMSSVEAWTLDFDDASGCTNGQAVSLSGGSCIINEYGNTKLYRISSRGEKEWAIDLSTWFGAANDIGSCYNTPLVDADGIVYMHGSLKLGALDQVVGTQQWTADVGGGEYGSPTLNGDGNIIVPSIADAGIKCVDRSDGSILWSYTNGGLMTTPMSGCPAVDSSGNIYLPDCDTYAMCAVDSDGTELWTTSDADMDWYRILMLNSPAISGDLVYFTGIDDRRLWGFSLDDGTTVVKADALAAGQNLTVGPSVLSSGDLVGATVGGRVVCWDKDDGSLLWNTLLAAGAALWTPLVVDAADNIYASGYSNDTLYCLDKNGTLAWSLAQQGYMFNSGPSPLSTGAFLIGLDDDPTLVAYTGSSMAATASGRSIRRSGGCSVAGGTDCGRGRGR